MGPEPLLHLTPRPVFRCLVARNRIDECLVGANGGTSSGQVEHLVCEWVTLPQGGGGIRHRVHRRSVDGIGHTEHLEHRLGAVGSIVACRSLVVLWYL